MKNNRKIKAGKRNEEEVKRERRETKLKNQQVVGNERGKTRNHTPTRRHMHIYKYMFVKNFFTVHMFISIDY